jgi:FAD-dependent urate hydroxylase
MNVRVNPVFSDNCCEVAIIGAGPYGLAVAAHLRAARVRVHIFGETMSFWRQHMPRGMQLRSPWIATHIAHPRGDYLLDDYFDEIDLPYPELLPIENFITYGDWFQAHVAPDLDTRTVIRVEACDQGFYLILDDGERVLAKRVVVATGLLDHEHRPSEFDGLPRSLVSHSSEHTDSERFRGRRVVVIGGGQSACESAALLHEAGADVEIICRGNLLWNGDPATRGALRKMVRPLLKSALIPPSQVGPFPFNWLVESPGIIRHLSQDARDRLNMHCLRATAILWLRSRLRGIPVSEGRRIINARRDGDRIALTLDDGSRHIDHVLLATGYRIDVKQIRFLDPKLRERIARHDGSPVLSGGFESSVSGLHFVGASAVASFGPLLRFIAGTAFAARRITQWMPYRDRSSRITTASSASLRS